MRKVQRILVAVKDPSSRSLPAVMKAAQLAKAWDASLDLFHCIATPLYIDAYSATGTPEDVEKVTLQQQRERLERLARKLRSENLQVSADVE